MDSVTIIAIVSIITSGATMALGTIFPAFGQGKALTEAMRAMAQQPDESNAITRTLFIGMALIESFAIYCLVIAMILIFANPFWNYFSSKGL